MDLVDKVGLSTPYCYDTTPVLLCAGEIDYKPLGLIGEYYQQRSNYIRNTNRK